MYEIDHFNSVNNKVCLLDNIHVFALCPIKKIISKFRGGATLLPFLLININL